MTIDRLKEKYPELEFGEYISFQEPIVFRCKEHGEFSKTPKQLLSKSGVGCNKCKKTRKKKEKITKEKFNNEKYTYLNLDEIGTKSAKNITLKIKCNCGNVFEQNAFEHYYYGHGCRLCGIKTAAKKRSMSLEEFKEKSRKIHGDKYDYSLVEYINESTKVKIKCKICEEIFFQSPNSHLSGKGCSCNYRSKGEYIFGEYLKEKGIQFERQVRFEECKNILSLPFDFYIPEKKLLIEIQGGQHFKPVDYFGGKEEFEKRKDRDLIKKNFAEKNFTFLELTTSEVIKIKKGILKCPFLERLSGF